MNNQQCMNESTYSYYLDLNENIEGFYCYPFAVNLDKSMGSCNTLNDLSNEYFKLYVPNKTEGLNLSVFNMIMGINESKILTKHI